MDKELPQKTNNIYHINRNYVYINVSELPHRNSRLQEYLPKDHKLTQHHKRKPVKSEDLGLYTITAYCSCKKCCGKSDGITGIGKQKATGRAGLLLICLLGRFYR